LTYCPVLNLMKSSDSCHGVLPLQLRAMPADRGGNLGRPKLSFQLECVFLIDLSPLTNW
jgi:hypothetical protein